MMAKQLPILFRGPMVRAILDGSKTQTRRPLKKLDRHACLSGDCPHWDKAECAPVKVGHFHPTKIDRRGNQKPGKLIYGFYTEDGEWGMPSPFGEPGDELWVRETWTPDHSAFYPNFQVVYRADKGFDYDREDGKVYSPEQKAWYPYRWRPAIHMPRSAARIYLTVTAVRAELVQDISEKDAIAEGFPGENCYRRPEFAHLVTDDGVLPQEQFRDIWQSTYGSNAWTENGMVGVYEFERKVVW